MEVPIGIAEPLAEISQWLVTEDFPPRDMDGLDHERCTILHNAIFKHGWIRSGRNPDEFDIQTRPWLELNTEREQDSELDASVLEFLRHARALPPDDDEVHFFYNVNGLDLSDVGNHEATFPDGDDETFTMYSK